MTASRFCLPAIAGLVVAVVLAGCDDRSSSRRNQPSSTSPQNVNVVAVESQRLNATLSLPAQIVPYETVAIFPKVTGFIESIRVDRGSHVKAGELLVRLYAPELVAQRAQAEASLQTAQSQLVAAQAKLTSDEGTYQHLTSAAKTPGVVAGNDLLVAEQTAAADRAQVEAGQNSVRSAQDALRSIAQLESYLEIRAPFDGVITERNLHPGALAGPTSGQAQQPILRIEDMGRLRLIVPVPEQYAAGVREGQQVAFTVPSYPGQSFHALIARISHDINQNTRTMAVELEVRNSEITPGIFATVQWPIQRAYPTLFVPASAVTSNLQRTFVIAVRQGKAEWIDVKTGATENGKAEVFGDLKAGDQVIARASDDLAPGTPVTVRPLQGQ